MGLPKGILLLGGAVLLALLAAGAFMLVRQNAAADYALQEILFSTRFQQHDDLIAQSAARHGVSPSLVKAVVWRESRFQPEMVGAHGERGLMQITEPAATDWVLAEKIETFVPTDLFDPKTNLDAGTWYLARALRHWKGKDDPVPFALAEYNAGRSRVKRWERESGGEVTAEALRAAMDFPSTREYVRSIIERHRAYLVRGEFGENPSSPPIKTPGMTDDTNSR
jgi:soluble lytic murein transglycosylase